MTLPEIKLKMSFFTGRICRRAIGFCSQVWILYEFVPELTLIFFPNLLEDSPKKHPFPCPTTYRTALLHYVDIASVVKTHVLRELAEYAKDFHHKEFLINITDTTEEAKVSQAVSCLLWLINWSNYISFSFATLTYIHWLQIAITAPEINYDHEVIPILRSLLTGNAPIPGRLKY